MLEVNWVGITKERKGKTECFLCGIECDGSRDSDHAIVHLSLKM